MLRNVPNASIVVPKEMLANLDTGPFPVDPVM